MDAGDCGACFALTEMGARNIGDGYCDVALNITECGNDGSDCLGVLPCGAQESAWGLFLRWVSCQAFELCLL